MMKQQTARTLRIIVSGGGTGGHIFPAIAIADELARLRPDTTFLFVGAEGKMEMEKVPKAGYQIKGLPIRGLERRLSWANLTFPFRLLSSLWKSRQIIKEFKPDVVIGTGGYAGGPILFAAAKMGIPTLIQEPNAFAGLANKWVGRYVDTICVAFEGMRRFFPRGKVVVTGNPVREALLEKVLEIQSSQADESAKRVLLMGGSGGARSLNEALAASTDTLASRPDIHWTWQCGKFYYDKFRDCPSAQLPNVTISAFIDEMDKAYAAADIVIGRAGSTTIAEIEFLGKPTILVPSPWVAEDHQTMNAKALVAHDAAILLPDADAEEKLVTTVFKLLDNEARLKQLGANAKAQAKPGAVTRIVEEVLALIEQAAQDAPPPHPFMPSSPHPRIPSSPNPLTDPSLHPAEVYFIGIGGIGMSALARYYNQRGVKVSGYDRTQTNLTEALVKEGIKVHYEATPAAIPGLGTDRRDILYVYTPAIPADFPELLALKAAGKTVHKRSEVLGLISKAMRCVGVAGTHGKTTTTTLTTHLMRECGIDVSAFLGGIPGNFSGNYVHGESDWVVVEADEYDRSFLQLDPELAVILSMDADHLDIYGDHATMLELGFGAFANRIDQNGLLLVRAELAAHFEGKLTTAVKSFGLEKGDYHAEKIRVEDGLFTFDVHRPNGLTLTDLKLPLPGRHNVENATAAIALTLEAGGNPTSIRAALASFKGIGRRFEIVVRTPDFVLIDDYAHHPTELRAAIAAARELYPNREITAVFQPHLFSRTRDFADDFAEALDLLDRCVLLPIYPAREQPIEGVSSKMLMERMELANVTIVEKEALLSTLQKNRPEILLVLGAGDIDRLVAPLAHELSKTINP